MVCFLDNLVVHERDRPEVFCTSKLTEIGSLPDGKTMAISRFSWLIYYESSFLYATRMIPLGLTKDACSSMEANIRYVLQVYFTRRLSVDAAHLLYFQTLPATDLQSRSPWVSMAPYPPLSGVPSSLSLRRWM